MASRRKLTARIIQAVSAWLKERAERAHALGYTLSGESLESGIKLTIQTFVRKGRKKLAVGPELGADQQADIRSFFKNLRDRFTGIALELRECAKAFFITFRTQS